MGSRREVSVLQHNLEVGRNNTIALVLCCCLSLGHRELNCGPGKEEAKSASHKALLSSRRELCGGREMLQYSLYLQRDLEECPENCTDSLPSVI